MEDSREGAADDRRRWERLTDKQRECLDLLLERKTSKQIARLLGIAKPTVDQRLTAARNILGARDRDETALAYGRLKHLYDRITYDPVALPLRPALVPSDFPDGDLSSLLELSDHVAPGDRIRGVRSPFGDLWRHDHSPARRISIMMAMLTALLVSLLAGLGIAQALSRLISG